MSPQRVISCSMGGELRVWDIESGKYIKKYDLNLFTTDPITTLKLSDGGILFMGCKDSNVYKIDMIKGKLSIVYEGHWS